VTLANFSLQTRWLEFLGLARTSVGYCHVHSGCRIAISGLHGTNGIARAQNGSVYVGSSKAGQIRVYEEQTDQSLVLTDIIALGASMIIWGHGDQDKDFFSTTDRIVDNLSIDTNGALWAAGLSASLSWLSAYHDPEKVAPSSALRITKNTGNQAFFGEKLKIEKVRDITLKACKGTVSYNSRVGI